MQIERFAHIVTVALEAAQGLTRDTGSVKGLKHWCLTAGIAI